VSAGVHEHAFIAQFHGEGGSALPGVHNQPYFGAHFAHDAQAASFSYRHDHECASVGADRFGS
jgi:hypothetical protein